MEDYHRDVLTNEEVHMDKNILEQYCDLQTEIKDVKKRLDKLQEQTEDIVKDSVKGSSKYFPYIEMNYKLEGVEKNKNRDRKIKRYKLILENYYEDLLEMQTKVEEYIENLPNIRMRTILRLRYIDKLSWVKVALKMGGNSTEDSVRKEHERFLENN